MPCTSNAFIKDDVGKVWRLDILPSGQLQATQVAGALPTVSFLNDIGSASVSFRIGMNAIGRIYAAAAAFNGAYTTRIAMFDSSGSQWFLVINKTGFLQSIAGTASIAPPVVGQLVRVDDAYPKAKQPGGIGTPVTDPLSNPPGPYPNLNISTPTGMAALGLWVAGCGHWHNTWMIVSVNFGCGPGALVLCPICGFCQKTFFPYSAIHDFSNDIIIA